MPFPSLVLPPKISKPRAACSLLSFPALPSPCGGLDRKTGGKKG